jgi:hypothetical protein
LVRHWRCSFATRPHRHDAVPGADGSYARGGDFARAPTDSAAAFPDRCGIGIRVNLAGLFGGANSLHFKKNQALRCPEFIGF